MRIRIALLAVLFPPLSAGAETPIAEVVCAPRAEMVARLTKGHGAQVAASGLRDAEAVVEVWADDKGDWTLVQSYANGLACILAMGEAWEAALPPPA